MRRLVLIFAFLLSTFAAIPAVSAQTPEQLPERARQRLDQMKERLALTPAQIEQVRPIWTEEAQKLKALREKSSAGSGRRRDRLKLARELRDIQHDTDDQLEKVLSKDQMKELKKLRDEWREQLRDRAGER
jgi:hypothetical protein